MKLLARLLKQTRAPTEPISHSIASAKPTFEALLPKTPELKEQFIEYVKIVNNSGGLYHQLDFGDGLIINGRCNMARYVCFYDLPISLEGMTILDIGTSSGYFALECIRRGGEVTAIDIVDNQFLEVFASLTNEKVNYIKKNIYEIDAEFGQFDVVVCGSLLEHLPDPFGALRKIRSVCKGEAIISTACPEDSGSSARPVCEFHGWEAEEGSHWSYWRIGAVALKNMLTAAGFAHAINERYFTLVGEPGYGISSPHIVMTGLV
jgi:2-polyprenyl-3-methyl-5-hydroxy-6-metoxy-1,4-benzoquinol methylase